MNSIMPSPLCRVCVSETNEFVYLLNLYYEHVPVNLFIKDQLRIMIGMEEDPTTLVVCSSCNKTLSDFYLFHKKVIKAQEKFQQMKKQGQVECLEVNIRDPLKVEDIEEPIVDQPSIFKETNNESTELIIKQEIEQNEDNFSEINQKEHQSGIVNVKYLNEDVARKKLKVETNEKSESNKLENKEELTIEYQHSDYESTSDLDFDSNPSCSQSSVVIAEPISTIVKVKSDKKTAGKKEKSAGKAFKRKYGNTVSDSKRTHEARQILLSKYKLEDIILNGKWVLQGDELDEVLSLYVDMKCNKCPRLPLFSNYKELEEHSMTKHKEPPKLKCCVKELERSVLEKHVLFIHLLRRRIPKELVYVKCSVCNKSLAKHRLKNHLSKHLPKEMREFQCDLCDFGCGSKYAMNDHMKMIHPAKLSQCDQCGKSFKTIYVLQIHKEIMHQPSDHLCQECGKRFKTKGYLQLHMKVHTHTQRVKCDECGIIVKMTTYRMHKRRHLYQKEEQQCPQCPFRSKNIKSHIKRVHSEDKPHPCSSCSKQFNTQKAMLDHMSSKHTGVPRYSCEFCARVFMSSGNFHTHRKKMHPEQVAELNLQKKLEKEKYLEANNKPDSSNRYTKVVNDVDVVLKNIEEIDNNK